MMRIWGNIKYEGIIIRNEFNFLGMNDLLVVVERSVG